MSKIASVERTIPRHVAEAMTNKPVHANPWVFVKLQDFLYTQDEILVMEDGRQCARSTTETCKPEAVASMCQYDSNGNRDGISITFLADGRLHHLERYEAGEVVEMHNLRSDTIDQRLRKLDDIEANGKVFWKITESDSHQANGLVLRYKDQFKNLETVTFRQAGDEKWSHEVPPDTEVVPVEAEASGSATDKVGEGETEIKRPSGE